MRHTSGQQGGRCRPRVCRLGVKLGLGRRRGLRRRRDRRWLAWRLDDKRTNETNSIQPPPPAPRSTKEEPSKGEKTEKHELDDNIPINTPFPPKKNRKVKKKKQTIPIKLAAAWE
jgi:hypothetical protein